MSVRRLDFNAGCVPNSAAAFPQKAALRFKINCLFLIAKIHFAPLHVLNNAFEISSYIDILIIPCQND